jgi:hypothetical protein
MSKKDKPLYRIVVEPGGGHGQYPKYEKFWHIEKWNDEHKRYFRQGNGGLAFTKWGMWRAIRKELKRINAGYTVQHFTINGVRID